MRTLKNYDKDLWQIRVEFWSIWRLTIKGILTCFFRGSTANCIKHKRKVVYHNSNSTLNRYELCKQQICITEHNTMSVPWNLILTKSRGCKTSVATTPPDTPATIWLKWPSHKTLLRGRGSLRIFLALSSIFPMLSFV